MLRMSEASAAAFKYGKGNRIRFFLIVVMV
jgi:hypothetical protein